MGLGVLEAAEAVLLAGAEAWAAECTTAALASLRPLLVNRAGGSVAMAARLGPPGHSSGGCVTVATRAGPGGWKGGGGTPLSLPPSSPVPLPPPPAPPLPFASSPSGASSASRGCQGVGKQPRRGEEGRGWGGMASRCAPSGAVWPGRGVQRERGPNGGGKGETKGGPRAASGKGGSGEEARGRQGRAARRRRRRHERVFPVPAAPVSHGSRAATPNRAWGSRPAPLQPPVPAMRRLRGR